MYDGIWAESESESNDIRNNRLSGNEEHDCHDDSSGSGTGGTADTWTGNQAGTANRAGICPGATVDPPENTKSNKAASSSPRVSPAKR